jgi:hypothetical protein
MVVSLRRTSGSRWRSSFSAQQVVKPTAVAQKEYQKADSCCCEEHTEKCHWNLVIWLDLPLLRMRQHLERRYYRSPAG